jgi:hypothetical protein
MKENKIVSKQKTLFIMMKIYKNEKADVVAGRGRGRTFSF